jgi:hypothetical protein
MRPLLTVPHTPRPFRAIATSWELNHLPGLIILCSTSGSRPGRRKGYLGQYEPCDTRNANDSDEGKSSTSRGIPSKRLGPGKPPSVILVEDLHVEQCASEEDS